MKELEKALKVEEGVLSGAEREKALKAFHAQTQAWDVALPHVEPLIWHFGLNDFYHTGLIEYWIANEAEAGYCAKYLYLFDGQTCPTHLHRTKVETFFVVKGKARMVCDGVACEMKPGDTFLVPAGKFHSFTGIGPLLLLEVSMPCVVDDNLFEDSRVPYGANYRKGASR
jgi:mannose-6-phosphate isomerase-like protein (cupin superfamily)